MQFMVLIRRRVEAFDEAQLTEVLGPEAERARALYAAGSVRAINSRGDVPGAVLMVEAADLGAATAIVGTLPLVERGMADTQIVPLLPYRGFIGG